VTDTEDQAPGLTRRQFHQVVGTGVAATWMTFVTPLESDAAQPASKTRNLVSLTVNGQKHDLQLDARTTLHDMLLEHHALTSTKKGCDHGQCGACTAIVDGRRINSCLSLAAMHDGSEIVTIEGLASADSLHPMQSAFIEHDGFQCGYCTPGQILSAVGVLNELAAGFPSAVTADLNAAPDGSAM